MKRPKLWNWLCWVLLSLLAWDVGWAAYNFFRGNGWLFALMVLVFVLNGLQLRWQLRENARWQERWDAQSAEFYKELGDLLRGWKS